MINNVTLVGRMTKDCDLRYTNTGKAVGSFTLACNRQFKTNGQQEADFINCVAWGKTAENLATYQKKGSLIGLTGRIQTRSFDNQDGKRVFITEVVAESIQFLESKGGNTTNQNRNKNNDDPFEGQGEPIDSSDLPF